MLLGANEPNISEHSVLEPIMKTPVIRLGVSLVGEKRPLYLLTLWRILASHGRWLAHAPNPHFWLMKLSIKILMQVLCFNVALLHFTVKPTETAIKHRFLNSL